MGAHANVGGGYESDLLPQMPLRWIMKKASLYGLTFRNDVELDGNVLKASISNSYSNFMYGAYSKFYGPYYRPIGQQPQQAVDGTQTSVNETINSSVFDRWRAVPGYRPPNLVEWAKQYKADIASLQRSVMAAAPLIPAPD